MKKRILSVLFLLGAIAACEPNAKDGPAPGSAPSSSAITITNNDEELLIASEDHDQVLFVDRESKETVASVTVGDGPTHVALSQSGLAVVTNRYSASLSVIDVAKREVIRTIDVGVEPYGIAALSGDLVAVTLAGEEALAIVDVNTGRVERKIELGVKDPRGVAKSTRHGLVVTHVTEGVFSRVNLETGNVDTFDASTRNDFGPQVRANHMKTITVSPDGESVLMAHSQANASTVRAPIGHGSDRVDEFEGGGGGNCGYSGCATELGAVVPAITEVTVSTGEVIIPLRDEPADTNNGAFGVNSSEPMMAEDCFDCGGFGMGFNSVPNPPSFLNPFEARFTGMSLNNPTAVAAVDGDNGLLVVNMGSKNAVFLKRHMRGTADDVVGFVQLGNGASALTLSHDGKNAYVWNQFDGSITEIEVPKIDERVETRSRFEPSMDESTREAEFREVPEFAAETTVVVADVLDPQASMGRKLFHDATDGRISRNHAISCASCHPDGRTDGQTWQFTFGPRNTPQLGGSILDTAPFHWPGDVTTHRELNNMTVLAFMGGSGLDVVSMDAIGAFIDTIRAAPSRASVAGTLTAQQARGQEVFFDETVGCASCHAGAHYTDNKNWDVGTQASVVDITSFQTPVLHGLSRSAPYLHDGSATTVRDLVYQWVATDRMGTGSHLSTGELDDLVAFLETL